ncbi:MAG: nucleoside kinase [Oscillospiraceae bacterium]|nr:nucleoside kinase [Oscillospiraceae bacterium]
MAYQLSEINAAVRSDPVGFMEECDAKFQAKVEAAADLIEQNMKNSPVILVSGPSGSGKTTTSLKIEHVLDSRGIETHTISMDDYFKTVDPRTAPRTPDGSIDLESPAMLDMDLMDEHFTKLSRGEPIMVPHFEFARQMRGEGGRRLVLGKDELAIFEGIHALNTDLTARHPEAFRVYISARSNVMHEGKVCFKGTWMRLARRAVRDYNFRGTDIQGTLDLWANVRRGEKLYISPYKDSAHLMFDSSLPYEVSVMASYAKPLMAAVPEENQRRHELLDLMAAFDLFEPIDPKTVPADSLLHEFIG